MVGLVNIDLLTVIVEIYQLNRLKIRRYLFMDRKIKLLVIVSVTTLMASGCSGYRGTNQGYNGSDDYTSSNNNGTTQVAGSGQVANGGSQRRGATCAPCNTKAIPKSTYTYKPAKPVVKPAYKPAPKPAGKHSQQYYIDRWNRQQAQQQKPRQNTQNYTGYGSGNYDANVGTNNTNYYDYSSAGRVNPAPVVTPAPTVTASNKSIYTGSYQQPTYKPYQPTTYSGGSAATTNTTTTYSGASTASAGNSYVVKKGDTVFEVMRQTGVYWKDIISMNNLIAPAYTINPGQTLRLK